MRKITNCAILLILFVFLPSIPFFREILCIPLIVSCEEAEADAVYILAGGNAFQERISTAVDLYHMDRVAQVMFLRDDGPGGYSFKAGKNWSPTDWYVDYLGWRNVPSRDVVILKKAEASFFGTLSEARLLAKILPDSIRSLVIVTSPAHTRRSLLAFRRTLPDKVSVIPYAAGKSRHSVEFYHPVWLEYLKLAAYWLLA